MQGRYVDKFRDRLGRLLRPELIFPRPRPPTMPEDVEAYMSRTAIKPTFADLLENCCRDMPAVGMLSPYLLSQLCEKFPAASKVVEMEEGAKTWTKSTATVVDKVQLTTYLQDLGWGPTCAALLERVLYERPKNVPAFLIELLAKGDVAPAGPEELPEDTAATKMQAAQRGRKARKERKDQDAAATRMQARQRGKNSRKAKAVAEPVVVPAAADADGQEESMEAQLKEEAEEKAAQALMDEGQAATKMQAIQRGKQARARK